MLTIVLGVGAALCFLLAAFDENIGSLDMFFLGLALWSAAWTARQARR